jgi:hypothetical protein
MDTSKLSEAVRLLQQMLRDDLELKRLVLFVERDRVMLNTHMRDGKVDSHLLADDGRISRRLRPLDTRR